MINLLEIQKSEENNSASLYLKNSSESISSTFEVISEEILITTNSSSYSIKIKDADYSLTGEGNIYLVIKKDDISLLVKFEEIYEKLMKNTASVSVSMTIMELKDKVLLQENMKKTSDFSVVALALVYYGSYVFSLLIYIGGALISFYLVFISFIAVVFLIKLFF